jgi:signal transduction histidine kinase
VRIFCFAFYSPTILHIFNALLQSASVFDTKSCAPKRYHSSVKLILSSNRPEIRERLVASSHDIVSAQRPEDVAGVLERESPDACIVDGDGTAFEALRIPVIVVAPDGSPLANNVAAVLGSPVEDGDLSVALQLAASRAADWAEQNRLNSLLERAREELNQFAFTVSHDTKEPIRTVKSYAELLQRRYKGQLDADADEFIDFVIQGANRIEHLINDLLAYSQAGREDRTRPERTEATAILQWALMNVDRELKEAGGKLTSDPLPVVEVDQNQLALVFQHLLRNSAKFRGTEPLHVHISGSRLNGMCEISVRDNGIGIDPQFHERVFGVFKRLHGRDVPGTGIGLAICRKIVEAHGGSMWVESELGKGATFRFTLPAHD